MAARCAPQAQGSADEARRDHDGLEVALRTAEDQVESLRTQLSNVQASEAAAQAAAANAQDLVDNAVAKKQAVDRSLCVHRQGPLPWRRGSVAHQSACVLPRTHASSCAGACVQERGHGTPGRRA